MANLINDKEDIELDENLMNNLVKNFEDNPEKIHEFFE